MVTWHFLLSTYQMINFKIAISLISKTNLRNNSKIVKLDNHFCVQSFWFNSQGYLEWITILSFEELIYLILCKVLIYLFMNYLSPVHTRILLTKYSVAADINVLSVTYVSLMNISVVTVHVFRIEVHFLYFYDTMNAFSNIFAKAPEMLIECIRNNN